MNAAYYTIVSFSTIGYGDIYPKQTVFTYNYVSLSLSSVDFAKSAFAFSTLQ